MLGDIITELYGARSARRAIITSFAVSILASVSYQVIIALPPFPDEFGQAKQEALELALGPVWIVVLAGLRRLPRRPEPELLRRDPDEAPDGGAGPDRETVHLLRPR